MNIYSLILLFFAFSLQAQEEKIITKKEFEEEVKKKVQKELDEMIEKIRPKNIIGFSKQLVAKENRLKLESLELSKREDQLKLISQELEKKILAFEKKQNNFIFCAEDLKNKENDRVKHMVTIISGMRPKNAADMLSIQDSSLAVRVMEKLQAAKVSKIFNLMEKEVSARLQKQYMTMKK